MKQPFINGCLMSLGVPGSYHLQSQSYLGNITVGMFPGDPPMATSSEIPSCAVAATDALPNIPKDGAASGHLIPWRPGQRPWWTDSMTLHSLSMYIYIHIHRSLSHVCVWVRQKRCMYLCYKRLIFVCNITFGKSNRTLLHDTRIWIYIVFLHSSLKKTYPYLNHVSQILVTL